MNRTNLLDEAQAVIEDCDNKRDIIHKLEPLFEPLTDLQKLIFASFVRNALRNKFERDSDIVV